MAKRTRIDWEGAKAEAIIGKEGDRGVGDAANMVLKGTNQVVPLEDGILMGTGAISEENGVFAIYYDTPYAVRMHQNPEYNFGNGRKGRFLKNTMGQSRKRILEFFAKALKVGFNKKVM